MNVYGESYRDYVVKLFPENTVEKSVYYQKGFQAFSESDNTLVRDYILNPAFLDYPLTGLTQTQTHILEKWLSDRFNETVLLNLGYLNFTNGQKDSDCFVLEAYLLDQYTGSVRNEEMIRWEEGLFLPTFRLPTKGELRNLQLTKQRCGEVTKYPIRPNHFLGSWNSRYIKEKKDETTLTINEHKTVKLIPNFSIHPGQFFNARDPDAVSHSEVDMYNHFRYLDEITFEEKDSLGKMSFEIIGENNFGRVIIADPKPEAVEVDLKNKMYRIAYTKRVDFRYWP